MGKTQISCTIHYEQSDTFGHLNNAQYASYFEKGREVLQIQYGIGDQTLKLKGLGFWIRDSYIRRILQVIAGQFVTIESRFIGYAGIMAYMEHTMLHDGKIMATGITEHYMVVIGDEPSAIELPDSLTSSLTELHFEQSHSTGLVGVVQWVEAEKRQERLRMLREKKNR